MKDKAIAHGLSLEFAQDWTEWFEGHKNWYTFTALHLEYEDEAYIGSREITFGLLGFNWRLSWTYTSEQANKNRTLMQARMDDFMKDTGTTSVAIHPDALADLLEEAGKKKDDDK
jgi:hypothetical protein